jgi:hypothetical protein
LARKIRGIVSIMVNGAKSDDRSSGMSCEEFQALLPDLIARDDDVDLHPHARSCEFCRAFIEDLRIIAEAARRRWPYDWRRG